MADDSVQVSRKTLTALVGSLSVSMLALAFLLGRMSAHAPPPATSGSGPELAVAPPPRMEGTAAVPLTAPQPPPTRTLEVSTPPTEAAPSAPAPSAPSPAAASPVKEPPPPPKPKLPPVDAAKIRKYLAEVEAVTAGTEDLGNPSTFATDLLNQSMLGDTSGIDTLLAQARQGQAALSEIHPPPSCKEHYQLLSAQMKASVNMLQQLKKALQTSDTSGLAALAGQGSAMQSQAQRLVRLTQELKEKSS